MLAIETLREWALAFAETSEQPHFEKTSFRVGKKIFFTLDVEKREACLKFSEIDQDVFITIGSGSIYAVPNKWGKQGWTLVKLDQVESGLFREAIRTAYCEVAPKKLAALYQPETGTGES